MQYIYYFADNNYLKTGQRYSGKVNTPFRFKLPFQGGSVILFDTQEVVLGWDKLPFQGKSLTICECRGEVLTFLLPMNEFRGNFEPSILDWEAESMLSTQGPSPRDDLTVDHEFIHGKDQLKNPQKQTCHFDKRSEEKSPEKRVLAGGISPSGRNDTLILRGI